VPSQNTNGRLAIPALAGLLVIHRAVTLYSRTIQYLLTADVDIFICPFVQCAFLLSMAAENICNVCRTNAAAEASYDRGRSSAL